MKARRLTPVMAALTIVLTFLASCTATRDITYMQGFNNDAVQAVREPRRLTIEPDDKISIIVSAKNPELAQVFNLAIAQVRLGASQTSSTTGANGVSAYTVDPNGDIHFPILGDIHVAGMTRQQVARDIEMMLVSRDQLKDPIVTVEFLNASVNVLGDVKSPGQYPIDKDNMTILQAISKAGDLNITGMRTNVLVVREENGEDRAYRLDLTDTQSLMQSPAYYMQQNDVVYIEPNETKKRQATANGNSFLTPGFWMSLISFVTTMVLIFVR